MDFLVGMEFFRDVHGENSQKFMEKLGFRARKSGTHSWRKSILCLDNVDE